MTASIQLRRLLASLAAVAVVGTALAQGTPPNPTVKNAPIAAGQQSSQQTPMGETGTPAGGGMAMGKTTRSSGTAMGASASTETAATPARKVTRKHMRTRRAARADRN